MGLGAKKQILVIGNDGVQLFIMQGKRVTLYDDFSDAGGNLSDALRAAFKKNGGPLTLVFDVVEQQYRRETMPKVGFMDKKKVVNRKLMMAFPQQQFRAFMPLKQKPRDNEGMVALFAGLSFNLTVTQIIDAVLSSEVNIEGAVLLPMESTTLLTKLIEAAHKRARIQNPRRWTVLITHHRTGGLRQIVIKDGELALTRMTPLAVDAHNPNQMVSEIAREFAATQTYLARFGYVPSDGLDLVLVTSKAVCDAMREQRLQVTHFYAMTVEEAGSLVGLTTRHRQDDYGYGEILHAGWIGAQRKYLMPMTSEILDKIKNMRQVGRMLLLLCVFGLGYLAWENVKLYTDNMALTQTIIERKAHHISAQAEFDSLSKELNKLQHDPEKVRGVLDIYNEYAVKNIDIEPMIVALLGQMDRDKMVLQNIVITPQETVVDPMMGIDPSIKPAKPKADIEIEIGFVAGSSVEESARLTNDFAGKLRQKFPKSTVDISEMVGNLSIDKTVQGVSEQVAQGRVEGRLVESQTSTLTLKGEIE